MTTIFDGMNAVVDRHLYLNDSWPGKPPRFSHRATLLKLSESPAQFGSENLIDQLCQCTRAAWQSYPEDRRHRHSSESWRSTKCIDCAEDQSSLEILLERLLARMTGDDWWNQVPVDSGLLDSAGGAKIDLVQRAGGKFSIVELKVNANTPLSAAIQVVKYGVAYLFFRQCILPTILRAGTDSTPAMMQATALDLVVLAPANYFQRFEECATWLKTFERQIEIQFAESTARLGVGIPVTFRFESFPREFEWSLDLAADASRHPLAAQALEQRRHVFSVN